MSPVGWAVGRMGVGSEKIGNVRDSDSELGMSLCREHNSVNSLDTYGWSQSS